MTVQDKPDIWDRFFPNYIHICLLMPCNTIALQDLFTNLHNKNHNKDYITFSNESF